MSVEAPIALDLDRKAIEAYCRKWRITELSLFGSVLRPGEFREDSDVDVLVTFEDAARWTLFIIGQRSVLAHDYGDISDIRVWDTVIELVPNLLRWRVSSLPKKSHDSARSLRTNP